MHPLIYLTEHQKIQLQKRIDHFIRHYPYPPVQIPIHPDEFRAPLVLRDSGVIFNLPVKQKRTLKKH